MDKLQLGLDVVGLIPAAGNLCDLANVAILLYRERYFEAGLPVAAVVPIYGQSATAAKLGRRGFKYADEVLQYGDNALRWVDNVAPRRGGQAIDAALDFTGKVHGKLPEVKDLGRYDVDELVRLRDELKQSVQERIRLNSKLGPKGDHGLRQAQEQDIIHSIDKFLEGLGR